MFYYNVLYFGFLGIVATVDSLTETWWSSE